MITPIRFGTRTPKRRISDVSIDEDEPTTEPASSRLRVDIEEQNDDLVLGENVNPIETEQNEDTTKSAVENLMGTKAPVWRYFSKSEIKSKAKCNLCGCIVSNNNSSTTMMIAHVKKNHQKMFKDELSILIKAREEELKLKRSEKERL